MASETHTHSANRPLFVADHPALDFINTVMQVDGHPQDVFQADNDVDCWLQQAELAIANEDVTADAGALLQEARRLRDVIREMVADKKAGNVVKPEGINRYLAAATVYQQLVSSEEGGLQLKRIYTSQTPVQKLAPVAEQAALLMADENFVLVRECEHPDCSLWFFDRTKAHRRRWCSMAVCGNRAKVARFRQQKK
ncbi:CGNR zinc finger domain-containing protein [Erwiniaceae bacterium BAC15a-03b]|uniref:CGNR zinc finger domain-containing protein n=1 Tax=Winslowiella arboricola TaxID=2978220 RepID=A0A9J6PSI8_9GAMM|nr:ABATE domain-containing protein [Winslowiella arboricola]MCU5772603.1 CGNR zinc finger domain-containing protein [Winslowiella arboricola]MCU5778637.1 CGNR zinc finger domain-containing protein [Winslowiella arboricola]